MACGLPLGACSPGADGARPHLRGLHSEAILRGLLGLLLQVCEPASATGQSGNVVMPLRGGLECL